MRFVADGDNAAYVPTHMIQFGCHPCRVGVYDLPYEQFVANDDNFCFHRFAFLI